VPRRGPIPNAAARPRTPPFDTAPPAFADDLGASAVSDGDAETLTAFWDALEDDKMEECERCAERWFDMKLDAENVCQRCIKKDNKRQGDSPFFFSAANHLHFGATPSCDELPPLSMVEEMLIARVHTVVNVLTVRGQQYRYKGHVAHFSRNVGVVYSQLPLLPRNLAIVLLRPPQSARNPQHEAQFRRRFRVRRAAVSCWLSFLRRHHPGYRHFEWNDAALAQLPEDGSVLEQLQIVEQETAQGDGIANGPVDEDGDEDPDVVEESAVPNIAPVDTELERWQADLAPARNSPMMPLAPHNPQDAHQLPLPTLRATPINEFDRSPTLFPRGEADFNLPRERSVDFGDWVQHAMRWHDGRFARHPTFRFVAFNMLMRYAVTARSQFFVKHSSAGVPSREDLLAAIASPDSPESQALIRVITRAAAKILGTRPFWQQKRWECEAFARCLYCPSMFYTGSPADLHWHSLYQHMPRFLEWLALPEIQRMRLSRELLKDNPHIAAWHFHTRHRLLRDIVLKRKFGLRDFWYRYEWQGRGSSHCHGLYWLSAAPSAPNTNIPAQREAFAGLWGNHVSAMNPELARRQNEDDGNPLRVRPQDHPGLTFTWLSQIINRCQRHACSTSYCLRVSAQKQREARAQGAPDPAKECRFFFPRASRARAELVQRPTAKWFSFEAQRNDEWLNQFSPILTFAWMANTDISPCTSPEAVVAYAGKYCTKAEQKTKSYAELVQEVAPKTAHASYLLSFVAKVMNKLVAERDYSAQEVCHILLGLPLQEHSRVVRLVDCRPLTKQKRSLHFDSDARDDASTRKPVYKKYLERNISLPGLRDLSYFEFLAFWNFTAKDQRQWHIYKAPARVLNYYPRYKATRDSSQYTDYCRVKLMLHHPHSKEKELFSVDGAVFLDHISAYECCLQSHHHKDDWYSDLPPPEPEAFLEADPNFSQGLQIEDWQELARMLPNRAPTQDPYELLGRRDIDVNYDWSGHVGRYDHPSFASGTYWREIVATVSAPEHVSMPLEMRDVLNTEQRVAYETIIAHAQNQCSEQLLLHIDGGGGTGKSFLINLVSSHLRRFAGADSVALAAPTGVASAGINGKTIHSLLRLPVSHAIMPLSNTALLELQLRWRNICYLIIDEKSMMGLGILSRISTRLNEIFPRTTRFFGGKNVIIIGDFFQLPPVGLKPLYTPREGLKGAENLHGKNAYTQFNRSIFLTKAQRQLGPEQAMFRKALEEMRTAQVSAESFRLLSTRVSSVLSDNEREAFDPALRIFPLREEVHSYNFQHLTTLSSPVVQARATDTGNTRGVKSDLAGNLAEALPLCKGARIMLLRNISAEMHLVNGSQGDVFDIGWAPGADPTTDPPNVVMVGFDDYSGPGFMDAEGNELRDSHGRLVIPILRVRQEFLFKKADCSRTQFPLTISYAVTVHKSQGITIDRAVVKIATKEFAVGLNYVMCSRVRTLEGLVFEEPFDRDKVCHDLTAGESGACALFV
jgi:Helitron helicase-like domain at N-terminus/Domain of unknown function (DUF6570)/PIF1-like helicase/DNA helicase Pif1, 2B domain